MTIINELKNVAVVKKRFPKTTCRQYVGLEQIFVVIKKIKIPTTKQKDEDEGVPVKKSQLKWDASAFKQEKSKQSTHQQTGGKKTRVASE